MCTSIMADEGCVRGGSKGCCTSIIADKGCVRDGSKGCCTSIGADEAFLTECSLILQVKV